MIGIGRDDTDFVSINKDGNVGIHTTQPAARLEVNNDARIGATNDTSDPVVSISHVATGGYIESFEANNSNNKRALLLNTWGGNVGIGIASPAAGKLHVAGDIAVVYNKYISSKASTTTMVGNTK